MDDESVLAQGGVERIGIDNAFIQVKLPDGTKKKIMRDLPTHKEGVQLVFECLTDPEIGAIKRLDEIDAVGHRIVQGGDIFNKSCIVTIRRRRASKKTLRPIPFAIPSRSTCWKTARICAPFRRCWAMRIFRPPRSIPTW